MRFALSLSLLALPLLATAGSHDHFKAAHRRSAAGSNHLQKREQGFATYYITGLGACGIVNGPGDYIVAMNEHQFPMDTYPSSVCFQQITITNPANGKTAVAQITDRCPEGGGNCFFGDMDMSEGLFSYLFDGTGAGKAPIVWSWGGSPPPPPPPPPPPTTTQPPPPPPSPTPDPTPTTQTPTSTPSPTPTPTSQSSSSSSSSSASASASVTDTFNVQSASSDDNMSDLDKLMLQFQGLENKGFDLE